MSYSPNKQPVLYTTLQFYHMCFSKSMFCFQCGLYFSITPFWCHFHYGIYP